MSLKNKLALERSEGIEKDLQAIYKELDEELAKLSPGCNACGECCNFDRFNHVLYATMIEVDYIKRNVSVPQNHTDSSPPPHSRTGKNVCPFLIDRKCTIRDYRTLGCRVFHCNPDYQQNLSQEIYNKYYRKIKDIAQAYGLGWSYAPFMELLYQESE